MIEPYAVPSISLSDVTTGGSNGKLIDALTTTGILSITMDSLESEFSKVRKIALGGICKCVLSFSSKSDFTSRIDNSDSSLLGDGRTIRTSIASATVVNDVSLPLPNAQIDSVCGRGENPDVSTSEAMEMLRDHIHYATEKFISRLDDLIGSERSLLDSTNGKSYKSLKSIIESANNLEHFHVYSKIGGRREVKTNYTIVDKQEEKILESHTDAGLLLSFVPGISCMSDKEDSDADHSAFMINVDGSLRKAVFSHSESSVVMMLGVGAQHWIKNVPSELQLRATKHAVQMKEGKSRAWYGMMHLVPENAIIQEYPHPATFADMRQSMISRTPKRTYSDTNPQTIKNKENEYLSIGCGFTPSENTIKDLASTEILTNSRKRRRRLDMVPDATYCDNATNFYCWMSCLDIPDSTDITKRETEGQSLYCADRLAADQNITEAVNSCIDPVSGVPGELMNTNCMGVWHQTVDGLPSQTLDMSQNVVGFQDSTEAYCYGGTSMYMDGFQWNSLTCVVYLFPGWILNTEMRLLLASLGTILFGFALEGVIFARRTLPQRINGRMMKLCSSTALYGLQITMGYLIMLVVMTYSVQLFTSTIIGLMAGHVYFQLWSNLNGSFVEGATPCCQNVVEAPKEFATENKTYGTQQAEMPSLGNLGETQNSDGLTDHPIDIYDVQPMEKSCCNK